MTDTPRNEAAERLRDAIESTEPPQTAAAILRYFDAALAEERRRVITEGLDVERLAQALVESEWNGEVSPPAAMGGYRRWAERILARLSAEQPTDGDA